MDWMNLEFWSGVVIIVSVWEIMKILFKLTLRTFKVVKSFFINRKKKKKAKKKVANKKKATKAKEENKKEKEGE